MSYTTEESELIDHTEEECYHFELSFTTDILSKHRQFLDTLYEIYKYKITKLQITNWLKINSGLKPSIVQSKSNKIVIKSRRNNTIDYEIFQVYLKNEIEDSKSRIEEKRKGGGRTSETKFDDSMTNDPRRCSVEEDVEGRPCRFFSVYCIAQSIRR